MHVHGALKVNPEALKSLKCACSKVLLILTFETRQKSDALSYAYCSILLNLSYFSTLTRADFFIDNFLLNCSISKVFVIVCIVICFKVQKLYLQYGYLISVSTILNRN